MSSKIPQQSDIIIHPDGSVSLSFLWKEDLHLQQTRTASDIPLFFEGGSFGYDECEMCPKQCGFNRVEGVHPRCGDEFLRVSTWGVSMGDEASIRGSHGSGAIMLAGCPLSCPSCHNPEMVQTGFVVNDREFVEICYELEAKSVHNIQILSPTVHMGRLLPILKFLKKKKFKTPILFKSSGIESMEYLKKLRGLVDIYLPDFKYGPSSSFAKRAGFNDYFELAQGNVLEMLDQVGPAKYENGALLSGVLIRHVMAPIDNIERRAIYQFLDFLKDRCEISKMDNFVNLE